MSAFDFDSVAAAVEAYVQRLSRVSTQVISAAQAGGRVLAQEVTLDRPSPGCDVSAMDGYALRLADAKAGRLRVAGEIAAGQEAGELPTGACLRLFTGAMVPQGAQLVIQREHVKEERDAITLPDALAVKQGLNIRFAGENGQPGQVLAQAGQRVTSAVAAAMASVGVDKVEVYHPLRVGVLTTGSEVLDRSAKPAAWQVRDSNGPALMAMLTADRWLGYARHMHVADDPTKLRDVAQALLVSCDALLLTGGVSAGDYDYVPQVLADMGATVCFHKLPIRPGKPVLAAVSPEGKPIIGLPGNPVSVMVTGRLIAWPALRRSAGLSQAITPPLWVDTPDDAPAPPKLTWYPLVKLDNDGQARLIKGKGSGDWVSAAASDGFVEVPAGESMRGRRRFFPWPGW